MAQQTNMPVTKFDDDTVNLRDGVWCASYRLRKLCNPHYTFDGNNEMNRHHPYNDSYSRCSNTFELLGR